MNYIKSKILIGKVNQLRIQLKLPDTSESFIKAYQIYKFNQNKQ